MPMDDRECGWEWWRYIDYFYFCGRMCTIFRLHIIQKADHMADQFKGYNDVARVS